VAPRIAGKADPAFVTVPTSAAGCWSRGLDAPSVDAERATTGAAAKPGAGRSCAATSSPCPLFDADVSTIAPRLRWTSGVCKGSQGDRQQHEATNGRPLPTKAARRGAARPTADAPCGLQRDQPRAGRRRAGLASQVARPLGTGPSIPARLHAPLGVGRGVPPQPGSGAGARNRRGRRPPSSSRTCGMFPFWERLRKTLVTHSAGNDFAEQQSVIEFRP
jgi:hypothetical protein